MQFPELAGRTGCNCGAVFVRVQAVSVVVSGHPRIGPAVQGAAQDLAAEVSVSGFFERGGGLLGAVECGHDTAAPGSRLTAHGNGTSARGQRHYTGDRGKE